MDAGVLGLFLIVILVIVAGVFFWRQRQSRPEVADKLAVKTIAEAPPVHPQSSVPPAPNFSGQPPVLDESALAILEIVTGPDALLHGQKIGKRIHVNQHKLTMGRNPRQVDLQLYNLDEPSSVSRLHCTLEFYTSMNCFMITDEGSSSGTKVDGLPIIPYQPTALKNGDIIELGLTNKQGATLRFHTVHNPPDMAGGRIGLQLGIEPKDTIRQSLDLLDSGIAHDIHCDVFLSYSRADRDAMRYIRESLTVSGLTVWSDESLEPGSKMWRTAVEAAIENARCVVAMLSPEAKQSQWVGEELNYAKIHRVRIFTVLVRGDESNALPLGLTGVQWIDMRADYETAIEQILKTLREYLNKTE